MFYVTLGEGSDVPQGRRVAFGSTAAELAEALRTRPPGNDSWWSVNVWEGDYRNQTRWRAAYGVAVDVDHHDAEGRHVALTPQARAQVEQLARSGGLPGNLFHVTPRGCRAIFLFERRIDDGELHSAMAAGAMDAVEHAIIKAGLRSLEVDKASAEKARMMYAPNAVVGGQQRQAAIWEMRSDPYSADDLIAARLPPANRHAEEGSKSIADAVSRFNRENGLELPKPGKGQCPMCGHRDCFGRLRDDHSRWACYSSNHEKGGRKGPTAWVGDALDIRAHAAGREPMEHLRATGYLMTPKPEEPAKQEPLSRNPTSLLRILRDPVLRQMAGVGDIAWNEMAAKVEYRGQPLEDYHLTLIRVCLEKLVDAKCRPLTFSVEDIHRAVDTVSRENAYHPVRRYLEGLTWDRVERIGTMAEMLSEHEAAPVLVRRWMVSAVARALQPGCKVDTALVLVGKQGAGKSTFFRALVGDAWFTDSDVKPESRDGLMTLHSHWVVEWSELSAMRGARDVEAVKAFLSRQVDDFRAPYARLSVSRPRSSVVVGTTNEMGFLSDATGGRRFWPLEVRDTVDTSWVASNRDQLWAEAVAIHGTGESWHLSQGEAAALEVAQEQFDSALDDPWMGNIEDWVSSARNAMRQELTAADVLDECLEMPRGTWGRAEETRIGRIMKALGWRKTRTRAGTSRRRVYVRPQPETLV